MIAHRRTWFYRLAGQRFAHVITFRIAMPQSVRRTVECLQHGVLQFL